MEISSSIVPMWDKSSDFAASSSLVETFKARFGTAPKFVARAPGRVNLIGEHIDYSGYGVLPMAVQQDVMIAVGENTTETLNLENVNSAMTARSYPASPVVIDNTKHDWGNYVLCGYKAIVDSLATPAKSLNMLVDGNIPSGAGLSSSSALVCCAALATAQANDVSKSKYVGTEGGGMDQSISFLAEANTAKFIEFNPIRATSVALPPGAAFVISNSLVEANKYVSAGSCYNKRVVECRLAARLLCMHEGIDKDGTLRTLGQVQSALGKTLPEMAALVNAAMRDAPYTKEDLAAALGMSIPELELKWLSPSTLTQPSFLAKQRWGRTPHDIANHCSAIHVFAEADRVHAFQKGKSLEELGALMNASHASCRDMFECSCPELDELTALCVASGALGSRLTGAGWGGCVVSLVPIDRVDLFLEAVRTAYYAPHSSRAEKLSTSLFVTQAGDGAAVIVL